MKKHLLLILTLIILISLLVSCAGSGDSSSEGSGESEGGGSGSGSGSGDSSGGDDPVSAFSVTVVFSGEGALDKTLTVSAVEGEDLYIPISLKDGYTFESSTPEGVFDYSENKLVIENITSATRRITVTTKRAEQFFFESHLSSGDTCDRINDLYEEGTTVTLQAGSRVGSFIGWSFGRSFEDGGEIVSTDKTFAFPMTSLYSEGSARIRVFSNYALGNVYTVDANGGVINQGSTNIKNTEYYTATVSGDRVRIELGSEYFSMVGTASLFYDDATFTRDGYLLVEYNTKPDGSGEGYSLGAKYQIDAQDEPILYCIWAKETDESAFTYRNVTIDYPKNASAATLPYWQTSGVEITSYTGNEETVVIPNKIGDRYVTSIAAGAFKNKAVKTLVFGRYILSIADGAFVGCSSLSTVHYSDGITYATDAFLDTASRASFKNLRINATMPPKLTPKSWAGLFAIKLTRVMSTHDTKRIIMIGGSSVYQGMSTPYLEALLNGDGEEEYSFINFGTTRIFTVMMYLDAIDHYIDEDDYVVLSPENHARCMGDTSFVENSFDDSEGMYPSLIRYLDISEYSDVFSSLSAFNLTRSDDPPTRYEELCKVGVGYDSNEYGDDISNYEKRSLLRNQTGCVGFGDVYTLTFNERIKSAKARWQTENRETADWKNPDNETWCELNDPKYADQVNRMMREIKATGARAYFAHAPVDGTGKPGSVWGVIPEVKADPGPWLAKYDKLIADTYYEADAIIGRSVDYFYHHNYFYDSSYHLNNWGRPIRTYQFYVDFAREIGIEDIAGYTERGTNFHGCLFESGVTDGSPYYKVDYIERIK